jgi:hypothetical protein
MMGELFMKKYFSLLLSALMILSVAQVSFAQTATRDFNYNVIINGVSVSGYDAISVSGTTMYTEECFINLTAADIEGAEPFSYEGKNYYSLREVAENNNMYVFWDDTTRTAIATDKEMYYEIKRLIESSDQQMAEMSKMEAELYGDIGMNIEALGMNMAFSVELGADFKIDIDAPFMQMDISMILSGGDSDDLFGDLEDLSVIMYDDGEFTYLFDTDDWFKMPSQFDVFSEFQDQILSLMPKISGTAHDLSFAALSMTQTEDGTVLEGNMYVSEIFSAIDLNTMTNAMLGSMGDIEAHYDMPDIIYAKYVFDADGNLTALDMKYDFDMIMTTLGVTTKVSAYIDLSLPTIIFDGDFSTAVPEDVINNAVDFLDLHEAEAAD